MLAIRCAALDDDEDDPPSYYLRIMPNDDDRETTETMAPETDREAPTSPDASVEPILPPAPALLADSYLEQAIRVVANAGARMAEDREERRSQHVEVLARLDEQGSKQDDAARLVVELGANLEILSGQFRLFRDACEARLAEGDERFRAIERKLSELESKTAAMIERRFLDALGPIAAEFEEIRGLLAELKIHAASRPAQTPAT